MERICPQRRCRSWHTFPEWSYAQPVSKAGPSTGRALQAVDVLSRAVLVNTGWDRHWRTDRYFEGHPFLTKAAATYLREQGAVLVGIDSLNIDDTSDGTRPVHSILLAGGISIVEHLTNLSALPIDGFTFSAAPPRSSPWVANCS